MLLAAGTVVFAQGLAGLLNGGDPLRYGGTLLIAVLVLGVYLYMRRP